MVWQIQQEQKKTVAAQEVKSDLALEKLERTIESIIQNAVESKSKSSQTKQDQLANINDNKKLAKDEERQSRRNEAQKGQLIQLPNTITNERNQNKLSDEDLALEYPIYHQTLSDDD